MPVIKLSVPNISCHHCIKAITTELMDIEGIRDISADAGKKEMLVTYESPATEAVILTTLQQINYPATPI